MSSNVAKIEPADAPTRNWSEEARQLGMRFGERAAQHDDEGSFVARNYEDLAESRFFSAGVPCDLGGGGASFGDLAGIVRELGRHCASTALSFSMHTHTVCANVFRHRRGDAAATATLQRLAGGELVVATTGANDWLHSSGEARPVPGGYRVTARKHFVSGGPGADVLVTSATLHADDGVHVLHFAVPLRSDGVEIAANWRTLGMRGTGSNDVTLTDVFVPEAGVVARRPAGRWHPMWDVILPIALPLISAAYVGLAEAAAALAVESARRSPDALAPAVGEMSNALTVAQLALSDMIRLNDDLGFPPSLARTNDVLVRKAIVATAAKQTVETAAEIVGGAGFFKGHAIERMVRDVRAMNFHPLPLRRQQAFSGRFVLGVDPLAGI